MKIDEKTLNKIKKLHALSFSDKAGESVAARLAMNKLLMKNGITLSDIETLDMEDNELIHVRLDGVNNKRKSRLDVDIINTLSEFFFVNALFNITFNGYKITLVGRKKDVELATYVMGFLTSEFERQLKVARKEDKGIKRNSFCYGFFQAITENLRREREQVQEWGLVVVDNKQERKDKMNELFKNIRKVNGPSAGYDQKSRDAGLNAGKNVVINSALKEA